MKMFILEGTPEEVIRAAKELNIHRLEDNSELNAMILKENSEGKNTLDDSTDSPVSSQFARKVLKYKGGVSQKMLEMLRKLYEADPEWMSTAELYSSLDLTHSQFKGLNGAFGGRIAVVARASAYQGGMQFFLRKWDQDAGMLVYRLPPIVKTVLEEEGLV